MFETLGDVIAYRLLGGIVIQGLRPKRSFEEARCKIRIGETAAIEQDASLATRHRYALAEVREIVGRIWLWVLIGIGGAALFLAVVPAGWVTQHLGGNAWYRVPAAVRPDQAPRVAKPISLILQRRGKH